MESVNVDVKNNEKEMAIDFADGWPTIPVQLLKLIREKTNNIKAPGNIGTHVGRQLDQHEKECNIQLHLADDGRQEAGQKTQQGEYNGGETKQVNFSIAVKCCSTLSGCRIYINCFPSTLSWRNLIYIYFFGIIRVDNLSSPCITSHQVH